MISIGTGLGSAIGSWTGGLIHDSSTATIGLRVRDWSAWCSA